MTDFGSPVVVADGSPTTFAVDSNGQVLLAIHPVSLPRAMHLSRRDPARGWQPPIDYLCRAPTCDIQFGALKQGDTLITERTLSEVWAVVVHEDGTRDERRLASPDVEVLSHVLSVTPDGEALSIWLTRRTIDSARFTPETGWSHATLVHGHDIELDSSWFNAELSSSGTVPNQYPMQLRRLADGRMLMVWAEHDSLVSTRHGDSVTRDATAQSLWSLVTNGSSATVQRLSDP